MENSIISLEEALKLEDYSDDGFLRYNSLIEAFLSVDSTLSNEILDFIAFIVYQKSHSAKKMYYPTILKLIG
jgi:hypothetical protein